MPVTDSTEDLYLLKNVDVGLTCSSSSSPSLSVTTVPSNSCEAVMENRAASMANNDCNKALSSPAEASPAKPASTSPATLIRSVDTSPATSHIASAADSLPCRGSSIINMEQGTTSPVSATPSTPFGNAGEKDYPAKLTFKGVTVTLESSKVWNDFYSCGTEMILTRQGRHMFPYCRYRISGLEPEQKYSMVLSLAPADAYKYRWNSQKWEVTGQAEHLSQGLIRAFAHHYSPCKGVDWMNVLVSFKKLKLTNNPQDQEGNIILHSLHRYIPRLHVIPVLDSIVPTADQPVVMGPESMTFTFPQTEFMAVTTYQNFRITQMKIHYNPFAKGFREDGNNPRLKRINREVEFVNVETAGTSATAEKVEDQRAKEHSDEQEKQIILKPIMSPFHNKDNEYVQCRGKHALGNVVVVQKLPAAEPAKEKNCSINLTPPMKLCITVNPKGKFRSSVSTPRLLPKYHKKKRRFKRWGYSQRKEWKSAAASPTVAHSPPLTVAMQPELDDVEGLLFVSFNSKAALYSHVGDQPVSTLLSESTGSQTPAQLKNTVESGPSESDDEKLVRLETKLLHDLQVFKHRQTIHPVLQEVGLKLSSLDLTQPIDLQYLGVQLPLPSSKLPEQGRALADDNGLAFISRTGKTSDVTKIKGWRNKFIKSKEQLSNNDANLTDNSGSKNLSAFCSNMLDEYLESEAQQISERAAAFSTRPQGSVAYELPAKSSSYVKTLDSVLKQRKPPTIVSNKPCPLSYKPLLNSGPSSPASPTPSASPAVSDEGFSVQQSTASQVQPSPASGLSQTNSVTQRLSKYLPEINHRHAATSKGSHGVSCSTLGLSKPQLRLFEMELGAWNRGMNRTQLAEDRLKVALSAVMTKSTHLNEVFKVPQYRKTPAPPCGQEFCRLGCVCESLEGHQRGPFHCRRAECMLGCSCFKQRITKHLFMGITEQNTSPSYSIKTVGLDNEPHLNPNSKKLWIKNICDSDREPLLIPQSTCEAPPNASKPNTIPKIREEDKDPVYKFLESKLTCARVRAFNSKPPPVETLADITALTNSTKPVEKKTDKPSKNVYVLKKKAGSAPSDKRPRTLIEIQSACQWSNNRKLVLEALCLNMNRNKLCQPFSVGPYMIRPVAKIVMQKPTESVITYRVRISLRSKSSDSDDSDEEKLQKSFEEYMTVENSQEMKEPQFSVGLTPFLTGIETAGVLRAKTASSGCKAPGLVQVNGKFYSHARLMLGRMGSLHPANRVAAFVTGRLGGTSSLYKKSTSSNSASKIIPPRTSLISNTSGTQALSTLGKTATTHLKMATHHTVKTLQLDSTNTGTTHNLPQLTKPVQRRSAGPFQSSSPVSLTVSPSLKTPSFLGQRGTYSFRICPPDNEDRTLPGVLLPGGFTLIQLPTPGSNGAMTQQWNNTNLNKGYTQSSSFSQMLGNAIKGNNRHIESNVDFASDDSSSDFSDDCEDSDVDVDEISMDVVDVETVEETEQQMVTKLRIAAGLDPLKSSSNRKPSTVPMSLTVQGHTTEVHDKKFEKKYTERQRRSEQRVRFDNLQSLLEPSTGTQTPRLLLLSLAVREIQTLTEQSKYLEEKKRLLTQIQDGYLKEIVLLSGKSEETIMEKLKDVCEKQKKKEQMTSNSSYSDLLQSKAAMIQAISPQSKLESTPLLKPILKEDTPATTEKPASQDNATTEEPTSHDKPDSKPNAAEQIQATAKNFVQQLLAKLKPIIHKAKSCHQHAKEQRSTQDVSPLQSLGLLSKTIDGPYVSDAKTEEGSTSSTSTTTTAVQPQGLAYPLIRSKDGRIILPSSMKPVGQAFYTLTLVNSNEGQSGEGSPTIFLQPLDPGSLKKQEINVSEREHPTDSDNKLTLDNAKCIEAKSETKALIFKSPLASIGYLSNSISSPSTALSTADVREAGLNQSPATALLTYKPVPYQVANPQFTVTSPVRRGRGRPRKYPPPVIVPIAKPKVIVKDDPDYAPTNGLTETCKRPAEEMPDHFIPIKRGRGRPPKNKPPHLLSPRVGRVHNSRQSHINSGRPCDTETNSSVKVNASRPLTRGSLGKDFPSAKRRSWIDLESELEVDIE